MELTKENYHEVMRLMDAVNEWLKEPSGDIRDLALEAFILGTEVRTETKESNDNKLDGYFSLTQLLSNNTDANIDFEALVGRNVRIVHGDESFGDVIQMDKNSRFIKDSDPLCSLSLNLLPWDVLMESWEGRRGFELWVEGHIPFINE